MIRTVNIKTGDGWSVTGEMLRVRGSGKVCPKRCDSSRDLTDDRQPAAGRSEERMLQVEGTLGQKSSGRNEHAVAREAGPGSGSEAR